jgi:hypothetical protein
VLAFDLALWVAHGFLQKDIVIILANAISLALISGLVWLKYCRLHSKRAGQRRRRDILQKAMNFVRAATLASNGGLRIARPTQMTTETCRYRGYDIVPNRQWSQWCVSIYATRADLPLFSRSTLRTLALRKEEAVAEAKQCIDRLLHY